jgi:AcrR family transcriptional regulator
LNANIPNRKQREFARREAEILQAALSLFNEDDWESVTVEQIASRAEVGKGTVYKHFVSKEEIYARLTLAFYNAMLTEFQKIDLEGNPVEILREMNITGLRYYLEKTEYRCVTQYCMRNDFKMRAEGPLKEAFESLDARFMALLKTILTRGQALGLFAKRAPEQQIYCLRATFEGAVQMVWGGLLEETFDRDEYIAVIADYMVAGLMGHSAG